MGRSDEASTHVLEAVVVLFIMISAITMVSLMENPRPSDNVVYEIHQDRLENWVDVLQEYPLAERKCDGTTMLEKHIIAGVNNEHQDWRESVETFLGQGVDAEVRLAVDGYKYPPHTIFNRLGGAGTKVYFEPAWKYLQPTVLADPVTGTEDLTIDVAAIKGTKLVRTPGEAIVTTVTVDGFLEDPSYQVASVTAMTSLDENSALARQFAQNITWMNEDASAAHLVRNLTHDDLNPLKSTPRFSLRVEPGLGGLALDAWIMPAGMRATMRTPRDWTLDLQETTDRNAAWSVSASGSEAQGWDVVFTLAASVSESQVIQLFARPPAAPSRPFDDIHARLGNGSLGESTLVVVYPVGADASLPREVFATTPYPVRHGTRALVGVVFANGGEAATVSQVDIVIPGGYDIDNPETHNGGAGAALFAELPVRTPTGEPDPEWTRVNGKHLRWTGLRNVEAGEATHWLVSVDVTSDVSQATSTLPPKSEVLSVTATFPNGYERSSTRWGSSAGVVRIEVPPASAPGATDGYPWTVPTPPAKTASHSYTLRSRGDVALTNTSSYQVMAATSESLRTTSAVANSSFHVTQRIAPLGGVFRAQAKFGSLAAALSGASTTSVSISLWPPSSQGCKPAATWTRTLDTLPLASIRDMRIYDPLGGAASALFLTGDDARAYRIDHAGNNIWTSELNGAGLKLEPASFTLTDKALFVGTDIGIVYRIDPTTGLRAWSTVIPAAGWSTSKSPNGVTALAVDEAGGRIAAATKMGGLELRSKDRTLLARAETQAGVHYSQLAFSPTGALYARDSQSRLHKLDEALVLQAVSPVGQPVTGFALAEVGVLVAGGSTSAVLDAATLQLDPAYDLWVAPNIGLTSAGDATGDGKTDLAYTHSGLTLEVRDGATGAIVWSREPNGSPRPLESQQLEPFIQANDEQVCTQRERRDAAVYSDTAFCTPAAATAETSPHALLAQDGHVALAYVLNGANTLTLFTSTGTAWSRPQDDKTTPTILASGTCPPGGAIGIAAQDGKIHIHHQANGDTALATQATEFAGAFTFQAPMPDAGFLGAHLLTADLHWRDAAGVAQAARLTDWIEVVHRDGGFTSRTLYGIEFLIEDRGLPMISRRS